MQRRIQGLLAVTVVAVLSVALAVDFALVRLETNPVPTSQAGGGAATIAGSVAGLTLDLRVVPGGNGTFVIQVNESNTLAVRNNVTAGDRWPLQRAYFDPYDSCGAYYTFPTGYAVFQGYYDLSNFTQGTPPALYNTTYATTCTTNLYPIASYLFNPSSDIAQSFNTQGGSYGFFPVRQSMTIIGYWTGGVGTGAPAAWHGFRGTYTVVAADEWGSVAIRHFSVL